MVAFSADKIISILVQEPGLFLEVKKLLVRSAFEQGRLIESKDLDDDAVFRLVREDQHTRALITHEIVDRYYVRAKPDSKEREEMERGNGDMPFGQTQMTGLPQNAAKGQSQEDLYWSKRDQQTQQRISPVPMSPMPVMPGVTPQSPQVPADPRRQLDMAQGTPQANVDYVDLLHRGCRGRGR